MPFTWPSAPEMLQYEIASEMWNKTKNLRNIYLQDWENFLTPHQVLRPGATPNRTPIYGGSSSTTTTGGAPSSNQLFIDPATGQVYGGSAVQYNAGYAPYNLWPQNPFPSESSLGQLGQVPGKDPYYYLPGTQYGEPSIKAVVQPFGDVAGAGGNGQTITGYKEEYGPEDYVTERFNPYSLPGYSQNYDVARRGLESQYNTSLAQLIAGTPRGGAMTDAMSKLALGRAESIGGLPAQIASPLIQDVLNKSFQASFGTAPSTATGAAASSGASFASRANAELQAEMAQEARDSQKGSGLGMLGLGFGNILGSAFGSGGGLGSSLGSLGGKGGASYSAANSLPFLMAGI